MTFDFCDEVGWPAEPTRVYEERERIFPALVRESRRQQAKLADIRYRERTGWPERDRETLRLHEERYRAAHRDELAARARAWRAANREHLKAYRAARKAKREAA